MSTTKTYDPTKICAVVGGALLSGFADGSMIKCERNEDAFKTTVGADGQVVRNKSANRSGKITFTLLQSSQSNAVLSGIALADQATSAGIVPIVIKDNNGTTLWTAAEAWVQKAPGGSFEKEAKEREWVFECADLEYFEGGY
jgi:hypothetical protein